MGYEIQTRTTLIKINLKGLKINAVKNQVLIFISKKPKNVANEKYSHTVFSKDCPFH